jgi:hypothetical protein
VRMEAAERGGDAPVNRGQTLDQTRYLSDIKAPGGRGRGPVPAGGLPYARPSPARWTLKLNRSPR